MRLATAPPFHLEATVRLLQRVPTNRVDRWDGRRWRRALPLGNRFVLVSVENQGTTRSPRLVLAGAATAAERAAVAETVTRVLGLERDPRAFARVARHLVGASPLVKRLAGMRPPSYPTLVEAFANAIAFQQVSMESGTAIVGRLVERFGGKLEAEGETFHAFPDAQDLARARLDTLRATGLSRAKALALRGAARRIESGALDDLAGLSTEEATLRLESLPGIGPWSSRLILLRGLGRLDAFPLGDVGVAKGLGPRLGAARSHEALAETLGAERGYLYFTALALKLLERGLISSARAAADP